MTDQKPAGAPSIDLSAPEAHQPLSGANDPMTGQPYMPSLPVPGAVGLFGPTPEKPFAYEPGVYFGMSFDDYLRIPYLNSSGIKDILISLTDYWANSTLNPFDAEEDDDTKAKKEGRAFHKRILEGRAAFNAAYAPKYQAPKGLKGVMNTNKDMEKFLKSMHATGYSGKTKDVLISMVLDADPEALIYDHMEQQYASQFSGVEFLDEKTIRYIELINKMVEHHPDLREWFAGGYPEVTVIFDAFGVRFKVRFDYMKIGFISDLKTFANQMKKRIRAAVNSAMRSYHYHIQASLYLIGADAAQELIRAGKVYGFPGHADWLDDYASTPVKDFRFAFLKKGNAPAVQPAIFTRDIDSGYGEGIGEIMDAVALYKKGHEMFGKDLPWLHIEPPIHLQQSEYIWR